MIELTKKPPIGVFKGFAESGLEFKAEIVSPYHTEYHPLLGSFILVFVTREHAILGRITKFYPVGVMTSSEGNEYLADLSKSGKEVPEQLKESKLRYNITLKLLGGIKHNNKDDSITYTPSVRKLPHLGAMVGEPTENVLKYICSLGTSLKSNEAIIGNFSLGEEVYDGINSQPYLPINFNIDNLLSKRTFVFARAGYGKSVLNKLLITKLYEKEQDVGMIIFDPEGEYAFPDKQGRPGLADVPELAEKIVVFTNKNEPGLDEKYKRMIAGPVSINLSEFNSSDIVSQCVSEAKQETVFAMRLRSLFENEWSELISNIEENLYRVDDGIIGNIIHTNNDAVIQAVKNNIVPVVKSLHDGNSRMMEEIKYQLSKGRIVIVDVSLVSSTASNQISGLILNELFNHNQRNFTVGSRNKLIRAIAVIEEAQAVLNPKMNENSPFVKWAKEGRKYELGSILVTQQPGAIANELLSQGDNFFAFHLLSENDLRALQRSNAHFSDDILANILNEPIKGNAYFWSAPDQPFVLPIRVINFENYVKKKISGEIVVEKTASEEFNEVFPTFDSKLRELIAKFIENDSRIRVFSNVIINDLHVPDMYAVSFWFLTNTVACNLPDELENQYIEITNNGNKRLKTKDLNRSLESLHISKDEYKDEKGYSYYVFNKNFLQVKKETYCEAISLKSSNA